MAFTRIIMTKHVVVPPLTAERGSPVPVAGYGQHTLMLDSSDGTAWCWGRNENGQCGDGSSIAHYSSPISVVGEHTFQFVAKGDQNNLGIDANGQVWTWGYNNYGQIGNGTRFLGGVSSPVSILGNLSLTEVAAGQSTVMALGEDGQVWCWGQNTGGTCGDNTRTHRSSPVSVHGNHSFVRAELGNAACALKANGEVWAWGYGSNGILGNGNTVNQSTPVSVLGGHSFVDISVSLNHTMCLKADGSCWTWGRGNFGQLGINSMENQSSPVSVLGGHSFTTIASGNFFSLALEADGSLWAWGNNQFGMLGINEDGIDKSRSTPVSVLGNRSYIAMAVGTYHCVALDASGTLWAWGYNGYGELGLNDRENRSSPVSVVRNFS